jgi:C_GCAxxG_C_C family probable redox protein
LAESTQSTRSAGNGAEAQARARSLFLDEDNRYGCAETTLVVLKEAFGLPDPSNSSAAMALNGGVAYGGDVCGAISGSAVAVGLLAGRLVLDHAVAKRAARCIVAGLIDEFRCEFGSLSCRDLIGRDLNTKERHDDFIASGIWRSICLRQVEFAVGRLASLEDSAVWAEVNDTRTDDTP